MFRKINCKQHLTCRSRSRRNRRSSRRRSRRNRRRSRRNRRRSRRNRRRSRRRSRSRSRRNRRSSRRNRRRSRRNRRRSRRRSRRNRNKHQQWNTTTTTCCFMLVCRPTHENLFNSWNRTRPKEVLGQQDLDWTDLWSPAACQHTEVDSLTQRSKFTADHTNHF